MCSGKISSFICIAELVTSAQLVVILDSFPADLKDLIGWKGLWISSVHLHFPAQLGGSLLSWPLAEARKALDNSLSAAWRWIPSHLFPNLPEQLLPWGLPIPKSQPEQRCHYKIHWRLKARQIFEFRTLPFPDEFFPSLKGHAGPTQTFPCRNI